MIFKSMSHFKVQMTFQLYSDRGKKYEQIGRKTLTKFMS